MQTYCCTRQSVTSARVKSAMACGAACGDAGTHNVCAHRMSQNEGFVITTVSFGRETSPHVNRHKSRSTGAQRRGERTQTGVNLMIIESACVALESSEYPER